MGSRNYKVERPVPASSVRPGLQVTRRGDVDLCVAPERSVLVNGGALENHLDLSGHAIQVLGYRRLRIQPVSLYQLCTLPGPTPTLRLSSAGDAAVNGDYTHRGFTSGFPFFNKIGAPDDPLASSVAIVPAQEPKWSVTNAAGVQRYRWNASPLSNGYSYAGAPAPVPSVEYITPNGCLFWTITNIVAIDGPSALSTNAGSIDFGVWDPFGYGQNHSLSGPELTDWLSAERYPADFKAYDATRSYPGGRSGGVVVCKFDLDPAVVGEVTFAVTGFAIPYPLTAEE